MGAADDLNLAALLFAIAGDALDADSLRIRARAQAIEIKTLDTMEDAS
ncbi:hypothetical protein [Microbacterium sp. 22296]